MDVSNCVFLTLLLFKFKSLSTAQNSSSEALKRPTFLERTNDTWPISDVFIDRTSFDYDYENFSPTTIVVTDTGGGGGNYSSREISFWLRKTQPYESGPHSKDHGRHLRYPSFDRVSRPNNRQLKRQEKRKSPYNLIVRLSVGCTGTLVTTRHVLTAAHCVHNGTHLTINQRHFRIEIPSHDGRTSEYSVTEIRLPRKWATNETYSRFRAMYDFSIITLGQRIPTHIHRPRVAIVQTDLSSSIKHDVIQFAGFPTGLARSMWRTVCSFRGAQYIHKGNVLHLKRCTASPGYSGAGIFKVSSRNKVQLIGVVSHLLQKKTKGQTSNYIVASTFTRKKKMLLCSMINGRSDWSDLCGPAARQRYWNMELPYTLHSTSRTNEEYNPRTKRKRNQ